jgi:hypothetical protein
MSPFKPGDSVRIATTTEILTVIAVHGDWVWPVDCEGNNLRPALIRAEDLVPVGTALASVSEYLRRKRTGMVAPSCSIDWWQP